MKKYVIFWVFTLTAINAFSQKNRLGFILAIPIVTGDNYLKENYKGSIDLGAQYRFYTTEFFNIGASANISFLDFNNENFTVQPDINANFIQPRLFGELHIKRFRGILGAGPAFATFSTENALEPGQTEKVKDKTNGLNINIGVSIDIVQGLFAIAQYDYIKIKAFGSLDDSDFNRNVNLIKIGLGYRF